MTATPAKTCVILLGASEYPLYPALDVESARSSALALKNYFESPKGIFVSREDILDLFGSSLNNTDQLLEMSRHIERFSAKCEAQNMRQNIFFIYIGHGIPYSRSICLAIASTSKNQPHITSLKISDLADEIKKLAAWSRRFVILDCCYAGAASAEFLSADGGLEATANRAFESHRQQQYRANPTRGTTVLCAADKDSQARAPKKQRFTAFSGILIEILRNGKTDGPSFLSLRDIWNIACMRISAMEDVPMPILLSPDQTEGDLADLNLFPNYAISSGEDLPDPDRNDFLSSKKRERIKIAILSTIAIAIVFFIGVKFLGSNGYSTSSAFTTSTAPSESGAAGVGSASAPADMPAAGPRGGSVAGTNETAQTAQSTAQTAASNAEAAPAAAKVEADQAAAAQAASNAAAVNAAVEQAAAAQAASKAVAVRAAEKTRADQEAAKARADQEAAKARADQEAAKARADQEAAKARADQEAAEKEAKYQRIYADYAKCHDTADQAACARVPANWEPRT